jgi:transcriptional regulator with XRE-family HTH domain
MNFSDRLRKLAESKNLTVYQLAELFGVNHQTMYAWWLGVSKPRFDFQRTLARFESEAKPDISPLVSQETRRAFFGSRAR